MFYPQNNAFELSTIVSVSKVRNCGLEMLSDSINKNKSRIDKIRYNIKI